VKGFIDKLSKVLVLIRLLLMMLGIAGQHSIEAFEVDEVAALSVR
jgi:hypothetical protein